MSRRWSSGVRLVLGGVAAALLVAAGQVGPASASESVETSPSGSASPVLASGEVAQPDVQPLGECTVGVCGTVRNASNSARNMTITNNWPPNTGTHRSLAPGESSTKYFKDTDGYYIPSGCRAKVTSAKVWTSGPLWQKINDLHGATVQIAC